MAIECFAIRANSGLNFYVGVFVGTGALAQGIFLILFPGQIDKIVWLTWLGILTSVAAPKVGSLIAPATPRGVVAGYWYRLVATIAVSVMLVMCIDERYDIAGWMAAALIVSIAIVQILHKIYFNIYWLFIVGAMKKVTEPVALVASIRRSNTAVSAIAMVTVSMLILTAPGIAVVAVGAIGSLYALISAKSCGRLLRENTTVYDAVSEGLTVRPRFRYMDLVKTLQNRGNWRWVTQTCISTAVVPPLFVVYLVERVKLDEKIVTSAIVISQVAFSTAMARSAFVQDLFRAKKAAPTGAAFMVISAILIVATRVTEGQGLGYLYGISAMLASLAAYQFLAVSAHLEVILDASEEAGGTEKYSRFALYNLILDLGPGIWAVLGAAALAAGTLKSPVGNIDVYVLAVVAIPLTLAGWAVDWRQRAIEGSKAIR
jgi:hypothetical protein